MQKKQKKVVAVGMSGGVDSTIAAWLLKKQGYDVTGVTMQIWDNSLSFPISGKSACFGPGEKDDIKFAAAAAKQIGIRHYVIPLSNEYKKYVIEYFKNEYAEGKTPNPCIMCNKRIKFGALLKTLPDIGIKYNFFSTGHYARIEYDSLFSCFVLKRGKDTLKDQSYFLSQIDREILPHLIFPLGNMTKSEVRKIAAENGFGNYVEKTESQDFIESDCYQYLFDKNAAKPGNFIDASGKIIGKHKGIIYYTIGQRKGLGLSGFKEPLYVIKIDPKKNAVIVGPESALFNDEMCVKNVNWLVNPNSIKFPLICHTQIRLQHKAAEADVNPLKGTNSSILRVHFKQPQRSIAPGQVAVFYRNDTLLGGGIIC